MPHFLSPKELAEAIGVSESSLKRWADEGLLKVSRTAGGHRRIALREAIRYIRHAGLPVIKPQVLGLADLSAVPPSAAGNKGLDQALVQALKDGQAEITRGIVLALYLAGRSVAELCDGPLAGAMHEVGDLWRHGPEGIFVEHRAVDLCTQALQQLRSLFPPPDKNAPVTLGGALEGDPYSVPTLMVATVLGAGGWQAINLGANLPVAAWLAAVKRHRPSLVWMSCSVDEAAREGEREFRRAAAYLTGETVRVIVGGRGWKSQRWEDVGLTAVGSMVEAAAYAEGLRAAQTAR
jgi:MerR family transcriptional regulator, light-induced transcriptional regulator